MFIVSGLYSRIENLPMHPSASPVRSLCNPTNREIAQLSKAEVGAARLIPMVSNQKQHCGSEFAESHDNYTPKECADERMQNNADFK